MKYNYAVKVNGNFYSAGEDVPDDKSTARQTLKPKPNKKAVKQSENGSDGISNDN